MGLADIAEDDTTNAGTLVSDLISGHVTDVDGPASGIAVTAVDTTNGTWQYATDGVTWSDIGAVSDTSALLLAAGGDTRVRFVPNVDFNGTVSLSFRAWDQSDGLTEGSTADTGTNGGSAAFSAATASSTITVLSQQQQVETLETQVGALAKEGVLSSSEADSLDAKLVLKGKLHHDAGKIGDFISQVDALVNSGRLTQDEADPLLAAANLLLISITTV